jgi:alkanesulfonate monooxygenase SsuD/methylene tetrahydromethanopterin reductase-like flavin-dependent oxidoreductase (luciferase family)
VQQPQQPIWIGSWSAAPRAARRSVRLAAGWQPSGLHTAIDEIPAGWSYIERACEAAGRDPATIRRVYVNAVVRLGPDRARALGGLNPAFATHPIAGTVEEVVDGLGRLAETGVEEAVIILPVGELEQLERIAADVMPRV